MTSSHPESEHTPGKEEREDALIEALANARNEREAMRASRDQMATERDEAKRNALGRFHDLTNEEGHALREAAERLGIAQGSMRLGDVAVAVAESVLTPRGEQSPNE